MKNELEELEHLTREIQRQFNGIIDPYRKDIWRYCLMLTRSPWDAEDLMQETLLKAYATLPLLFQPIYPKAYLFRIASNTWIDYCRKKNPKLVPLENEAEQLLDAGVLQTDEVISSMEILVEQLSPRQAVLVLLIDVFEFKIGEAADLISTTEATVKSALQRARNRLRVGNSSKITPSEEKITPTHSFNRLLDNFIEAYNKRDVQALVSLMDEHISEVDNAVFQVYGRDQIEKSSLTDWAKESRIIQACRQSLWDKEVIVVTNRENGIEYLHNIIELSIEDGKIVKYRDYYFSKEFLLRASGELNLPMDNTKNLFGNIEGLPLVALRSANGQINEIHMWYNMEMGQPHENIA